MTNDRSRRIILLIVFAAFLGGMFRLLLLRLERGDVYPPYSSLRSDPLGTRGLYESLENIETISVTRNFQTLKKMKIEGKTSIFCIGTKIWQLKYISEDRISTLNQMAARGARLIICLIPRKVSPKSGYKHETDTDTHELKIIPLHALTTRWGVNLAYLETPVFMKREFSSVSSEKDLPETVVCHTDLYFDELTDAWKVIYAREGHPAVIEKQVGKGSIVLCADSYFLSNEALQKEPYPGLLAWLIGGNSYVSFDEFHLGISERPGVAALAREYRLEGLFWGLLLLAGLFVWRNASYFVPPPDDESAEEDYDFASERDATEGFISTLQRNIPPGEILSICVKAWEKSSPKTLSADQQSRIGSAVREDPVRGYQTICRILSDKKSGVRK